MAHAQSSLCEPLDISATHAKQLAGPRTEYVVPELDPNQSLDGDEIDFDNATEQMGQGQGDEDEDEDDEPEEYTGSNRRPLPPCVQKAWEDFKAKVADTLYKLGTFWVPQRCSFFLLTGKAQPTADDLYNPRLFYWAPDELLPMGISCPNCGTRLHRHEYTRPRRVVDLQNCFYLVGQRYLCPQCKNKKSDKRTVTFNSWDPRIMKSLPPELRDEFPAYLSHRSAIAKPVFEMMRTCFQYGLGSKQFSNSLQVLHRLYFDRLHCQYLDGIVSWAARHGNTRNFTAFSSFDDTKGYSGFIPSSKWLGMMYNHYIEEHRAAMDQQAAMKSLRIGQMDHSYKVTKQIMKINGESVFSATFNSCKSRCRSSTASLCCY